MGKNKAVWFNQDNHDFVEEKAKEEKTNFNKKVNDIIKEKRLETEKGKV